MAISKIYIEKQRFRRKWWKGKLSRPSAPMISMRPNHIGGVHVLLLWKEGWHGECETKKKKELRELNSISPISTTNCMYGNAASNTNLNSKTYQELQCRQVQA